MFLYVECFAIGTAALQGTEQLIHGGSITVHVHGILVRIGQCLDGQERRHTHNGPRRRIGVLQMFENGRNEHRRRNGFGFLHTARRDHLFQIIRQSRQGGIDIICRGDRLIRRCVIGSIIQMQGRQIASLRKEIAGFHVHGTKIADADGFFKFLAFQGQTDAFAAVGIAKDISAEPTMMPADRHGKECIAVGTAIA